jgi:hypothetical protein
VTRKPKYGLLFESTTDIEKKWHKDEKWVKKEFRSIKQIGSKLEQNLYLQDSFIIFDSTLYLSESDVPTHSRISQ